MGIRIYNDLTRRKEDFTPISGDKALIYNCGPTVYNLIHVGNARNIVVFDAVRRYLIYKGYGVKFVQNLTDVDDKIITKANEEGVSSSEIAERYIAEFFTDADALNVMRADICPRATETIGEIIEMIRVLIGKGFAYEIRGEVFFDTAQFPEYGKLSGKKLDELEHGARVAVDENKKNASDFVLWKPAKPGEPFWPSPWSEGRPGWHIECSAMAKKFLGDTIDIHGGGDDLVFPHHENEIAQSEAANGVPFAKYWMHNAMINVGNVKMSKSLGNFFLLREAVRKYTYMDIRFFILSAHYRSPLNFSAELLAAAKNSFDRIRNCAETLRRKAAQNAGGDEKQNRFSDELPRFRKDFESSMDDDFNTANAVTAIFELVKFANANINEMTARTAGDFLNELQSLCELLGLKIESADNSGLDVELIKELIDKRQNAKERKDFAEADNIRAELSGIGVEIKDTRDGTVWKAIR